MDLVRELLSGISAQRPSHSLFMDGEPLPIEARMGGIFLGFLCGAVLVSLLGRWRAGQPPVHRVTVVCWLLMGLLALDGVNAFLYDGNLPHLYTPSSLARLGSGLLGGLALAVLSLPVVIGAVLPEPADQPLVSSIAELRAGMAMTALVWGITLSGAGALLWPLSLAMLAGVLVAFGSANVYLLTLMGKPLPSDGMLGPLKGLLLSALGLALLEVVAFGALRSVLQSMFGLSWGF